ncbi:MAG: glutamate-cysteine ligase family protein [Nocardioidaceae bacterium]
MRDQTAAMRLRDRELAEGYVASICFKHGPPRLYGVELEWTVHHADDPSRPLDAQTLRRALGPHAPPTLRPQEIQAPLSQGSTVSVEPGGQVELSSTPHDSVAALVRACRADVGQLHALLADAGLVCGSQAVDPYRPPTRLLDTPRYRAMQTAFDRIGPHGVRMMCSTAAVQVCLDAGEQDQVASRWAALHGLGPVMIALFANSASVAPDGQACESARMRSVLGTEASRSLPPKLGEDPARAWARHVLDAPLLCVRRPGGCWDAPTGVTFADWIDGALPNRPTTDDLDYHLTTMFTPVRPRGHLEVRYLDAQAGDGWITPVVLLGALMAHEHLIDEVLAATAPVTGLWFEAARHGLAHPAIVIAAERVLDLGCDALAATDGVPGSLPAVVHADLDHRRSDLILAKR